MKPDLPQHGGPVHRVESVGKVDSQEARVHTGSVSVAPVLYGVHSSIRRILCLGIFVPEDVPTVALTLFSVGLGLRVLGFRASGFKVQGLGFRVWGLQGFGFRVFRASALGSRAQGLGFRVSTRLRM